MAKSLYLTFALFVSSFALAQEKEYQADIELSRCLESDPSTVWVVQCISAAHEKWDKQLNINYKKLLKVLLPEQKERLRTSQRAWIDYRDKEIDLALKLYTDIGGTMWKIVLADRELQFTKERAIELEQYIEIMTY